MTDHVTLARSIHTSNIRAGWWTDLATGLPLNRNKAEMLMLTVSELSEASVGFFSGENDDHLPELPMFDVELADVCIRLYDQIGAMLGAGMVAPEPSVGLIPNIGNVNAELMQVVNILSEAMEHVRKNRLQEYTDSLFEAVAMVEQIANCYEVDLLAVIQMKRAYNADRLDHKRESRMIDGGKAF